MSATQSTVPGFGSLELDAELAGARFQPGPVVHGSLVIAQVRQPTETESPSPRSAPTELRSWVVAFDRITGRTVWKRFLAKGTERTRSAGRFGSRTLGVSAAQPLTVVGDRVFAGTHLGVGTLLDTCDGRVVWSFKNRRRDGDRSGWTGARAPAWAGAQGSPPGIAWAPADSDRLYWLRAEPLLPQDGRTPPLFLHRPSNVPEAEVLIGARPDLALLLARSGAERTVSAWNAATAARWDSPFLGPGEVFHRTRRLLGGPRAGGQRPRRVPARRGPGRCTSAPIAASA